MDVLFVQGGGTGVHDEWDIRMVESLRRALGPRYRVHYPPMPNEADPTLAAWRPALERELAALGDGAIVVGHSVGGTILIHVLSGMAPVDTLGAIVLIAAPFIGDGGWRSDEIEPHADLAANVPDVPLLLYHGEEDDVVPVGHAERYAEAIPRARLRRLRGRDHQLSDDLSEVARDIQALGPA
jgi:predicted alpha/beta hydrolase family esterase